MPDFHHSLRLSVALALMTTWGASAQAQSGMNDLFRSVSGALRGQQQPQQQQGLTTTMGVRGMDDGVTASAGPATADYALIETWMATPAGAQKAAAKRSLNARHVTLRAEGSMPAPQDKEKP